MVAKNEADEGSCYTYKAIYLDEIISLVDIASHITGKRNQKRASAILGICEEIESRMRAGECNRDICEVADSCLMEDL